MQNNKINLIGLSKTELSEAVAQIGAEKFRAKQLWNAIYAHGISDFSQMTTISKSGQALFAEHFVIERPSID
ncbi:MAG: 23S rRNA (adenine(2503)-C(2))-methyltransferase RlmN, partial [Pseudomonadota bacterium]